MVTVGVITLAFGSLALAIRAFPFAFRIEGLVTSAIPSSIASRGNFESCGVACAVTSELQQEILKRLSNAWRRPSWMMPVEVARLDPKPLNVRATDLLRLPSEATSDTRVTVQWSRSVYIG